MKIKLKASITFLSLILLTIGLIVTQGAEAFWSGLCAGFLLALIGLFLVTASISNLNDTKGGLLKKYLSGMILRFFLLTSAFCFFVFVIKINIPGLISGTGLGFMVSSSILVFRSYKASRV